MALTLVSRGTHVMGDRKEVVFDATFDSSYTTGGLSLVPGDLGLAAASFDLVMASSTSGLIFEYDYTNAKLKAHYPTGGASGPASLANPQAASGGTAVTSSAATAPIVAGQAREVTNATNLSTVTARVIAIGY